MIIAEIFAKDPTQVPLIENNDVIQAIPTYGPDNAFGIRILPRRARRSEDLLDTQALDPSPDGLAIDTIAVAQ